MDRAQAQCILSNIKGTKINGFIVSDLEGNGKSAAVYIASNEVAGKIAVKIYDPELESKYGREIQEERIRRELSLQDHDCPYLVKILGGGKLKIDGRDTPYLLMEYVEGVDLRNLIKSKSENFSDSEIRKILLHIYTAADYLLQRGLCHRDIKVDNVRIRSDGSAILLDLGVLRPIQASELTDGSLGRPFLASSRYSPPELLHRVEKDDPDGWKAVTIYQIGTVLYEIIQKAQLFGHIQEPPADLVNAVDYYDPQVIRSDIGQDLVNLTRNCLIKRPEDRLKLVSWKGIQSIAATTQREVRESRSELDAIVRKAGERYEQEIESLKRELEEGNRQTAAAIASAKSVFSEETNLERLKIGKQRECKWEDPRVYRYHMMAIEFTQSMKSRIVDTCRLILQIERVGGTPRLLLIKGVGLHGRMYSALDKTAEAILNSNISESLEQIWLAPFDKEGFRIVIRKWIESMIEVYFTNTKEHYEQEMTDARKRLEAEKTRSIRSGIPSRTADARNYAFNTRGQTVIISRKGCR